MMSRKAGQKRKGRPVLGINRQDCEATEVPQSTCINALLRRKTLPTGEALSSAPSMFIRHLREVHGVVETQAIR
jgi:hypothetical protein